MRKYRKLIIFLLDITIILSVNTILYLFPGSHPSEKHSTASFLVYITLFLLCWSGAQLFYNTYESLWRYAQSMEYLMLLIGGVTGYSAFVLLNYIIMGSRISIFYSMAACTISLYGMLFMRMSYRQFRQVKNTRVKSNRVLIGIYGAGEAGVKLLEEMKARPECCYDTVFFIDDNAEKIGKRIHNVEIKGPIEKLEQILQSTPVYELILTIPSLSAQKRKYILETCSYLNCRVKALPDSLALLKREGNEHLWDNIRNIRIDELLGRIPVDLHNEEIERFLCDKTVMVTGGGGSIGSELCRQIAKEKVAQLIIVDIYENSAYEIQQELRQIYGEKLALMIEIASVRDKKKMDQLFERYHPNIIFHAAAHKHVPLMEDCPEEAIQNNIFGTYNLVMAADRYGVDKFVLISSDKAVNPTNIMGASKRFCEMLLQSMKSVSKTEYVAVRFGNVLGSNGSVIPLFQKQIEQGGPVTVTDKRIIRYFMTISEAAQLVLQAGAMANNSEIYILDMGEPVKIIELAENLICLSGHIPYTDIPIIETGLRPGEKLYEELLMNSKELIATHNNKIYIERQQDISKKEIKKDLKKLKKALKTKSCGKIKQTMKEVVPTYKDPDEVNNAADF